MKKLVALISVFLLIIVCTAESNKDKTEGYYENLKGSGIPYEEYLLISRAVKIAKMNIVVEKYIIFVVHHLDTTGIVFLHKNSSLLNPGGNANRPSFEVIFNEKGEVSKSGFTR